MKKNQKDRHRYDDIIGLPRHVSNTHPHMPVQDRAAQFAPFSALTDDAVQVPSSTRMLP